MYLLVGMTLTLLATFPPKVQKNLKQDLFSGAPFSPLMFCVYTLASRSVYFIQSNCKCLTS